MLLINIGMCNAHSLCIICQCEDSMKLQMCIILLQLIIYMGRGLYMAEREEMQHLIYPCHELLRLIKHFLITFFFVDMLFNLAILGSVALFLHIVAY